MKDDIANAIKLAVQDSLAALCDTGTISIDADAAQIDIERCKDKSHGDWACHAALSLAKECQMSPRKLAELIVAHLPEIPGVADVAIAGPGFINFQVKSETLYDNLRRALEKEFTSSAQGEKRGRVLIEFVSANPTGPLHVGHGRGAAYGACLANLLEQQNWTVEREYYVNDAGRQIDILVVSVWLRYLALGNSAHAEMGADENFPRGAYGGDYIFDMAADCRREYGDRFERSIKSAGKTAGDNLKCPAATGDDETDKQNAETYMTALIEHTKEALGDDFECIKKDTLKTMTGVIETALDKFGVRYDKWFYEKDAEAHLDEVISLLKQTGALYDKDGAQWFRSSQYGDTKDRVLIRSDGRATYFATDIAYHLGKYRRGYDRMINIWGADHHGYVARLKAALSAMGLDAGKLEIVLVQFVNLWRDGERVAMSTRAGEFVMLKDLCNEIGVDAARFFYVNRKASQHMDFDLSLAKAQSNENPLFYVQYAHARICSVFVQYDASPELAVTLEPDKVDPVLFKALTRPDERELIETIAQYGTVLEEGAPHQLVRYLHTLAGSFHAYYNDCRVLVDDATERTARLLLLTAVREVIADGLRLAGVTPLNKM